MQMLVIAVELEQFVVGALLYDLAFVKDANKIGMTDGGETLGDNDAGTI